MTHSDPRAEIEEAIPHRPPFLFVDAIEDRGEDWLETRWCVPEDADFFRGHYPGQPVTPGVILSEHCFQTAALLISNALGGFSPEDGVPVLTKIEGARFRRMVTPGETVTTRATVADRVGPAWYMKARVQGSQGKVLDIAFVLTATGALERSTGGGEER